LTQAKLPAARPVSQWESIGQPIALAGAMWNHGATMREEFAKRNMKWPELTSQDLTDLLVYLRNLPEKAVKDRLGRKRLAAKNSAAGPG
jgi:hypothetical protein